MKQTNSQEKEKTEKKKEEKMSEDDIIYQTYHFGDTEFNVPARYIELSARGLGAQGAVW